MSRKKDGAVKGHIPGVKNNMLSFEEKIYLIQEWKNTNMSAKSFAISKGVPFQSFGRWVYKLEHEGEDSLISKTGKCGSGNPYSALHTKKELTEVERLRLELAKKEVECERLKKGYSVKGVGQRKEYVTINKKNSK